jgi:hypothetical protein
MKNKKLIQSILLWVVMITGLWLVSGCASMSCMQTARVTEKGRFVGGFGGGAVSVGLGVMDSSNKEVIFRAPFAEIFARYGVTEKLDLGAKLTIIGTFLLDGKYQFQGNSESKFANSAGAGIGFMSISAGDYINKIKDIHFPYYFSFHPTNWLGIYTNPRYVLRLTNSTYKNDSSVKNSTTHWYGMTGGLRFGKTTGFFMEYTYFGTATGRPLTQVTVGLGFGIR